ncbi:MAG: DoxX-like family protein [Bacteroidota bacterium]
MPVKILTYFIASVWLVNGLYAKVLGQVPRHEVIVGRILGEEYAGVFTTLIGLAEVVVAVWIFLGFFRRLTAAAQIGIVLTMNLLETILVPDLLLWGRWNLVFAILFCGLVYYHGFILKRADATT